MIFLKFRTFINFVTNLNVLIFKVNFMNKIYSVFNNCRALFNILNMLEIVPEIFLYNNDNSLINEWLQ